MNSNRIYRLTSIGRPLDPGYPTNRIVRLLLPAAGLVAVLTAWLRGEGSLEIVVAALVGPAVVLGGWALARELLPDVDSIAFVSLTFAFGVFLLVETASVLLLFVALLLVRIVNRTVGLPARITDSMVVASLVSWAAYGSPFPWLGLVSALAFALDALLAGRLVRQWIFAGVCAVASGLSFELHGPYWLEERPPPAMVLVLVLIGACYGLTIWRTRALQSLGDATGGPLSLNRVRAGMLVGFLVGLQSLTQGQFGLESAGLVWATLAGVSLAVGFPRRSGQTPIP